MSKFKTLDDLDPSGKTCLVRVDLNVPMADGQITDMTRIDRILPTLRELSGKGAKVVLLAHFGRPKGQILPELSLRQIVPALTHALGKPVAFAADCVGETAQQAVAALVPGEVILLENTRFYPGEEKNDPDLARQMAKLGDVFINDAFSAAHRAHVSTEGLARLLPAYAGRTMQAELEALEAGLGNPAAPVMAIVGGAKVSSKLDLLQNLMTKVDMLVIGGGMANTFLAAQGKDVGKSLCEHDLADTARRIMDTAAENDCEIILPVDAVVAREFKANAAHEIVSVDRIPGDAMMLDVGPDSVALIRSKLDGTRTLVWNGPLGAFEMEPFDKATVATARHAAALTSAGALTSVAGGGDTVAAMNHAGVGDKLSYVSTAGGAFLEWMEGKPLPGVDALKPA
uniref:phosphoglycerate kinase n=1 Tax=Pararhizobium sp. IMCC3301 TaxID=3067904 RepID=UPI002740A5F3|nr:phosphoglycerate kinase [Pararhizobium sp. IMCC3301]